MQIDHEARQFIAAIASNSNESRVALTWIRDALQDGEALAYLGVTDDDQSMVEHAYHMVYDWIMADGLTYLDQAGV